MSRPETPDETRKRILHVGLATVNEIGQSLDKDWINFTESTPKAYAMFMAFTEMVMEGRKTVEYQ